jgi:DNA-binding CsgD family transcriptional regulator/tetratricopeptide (TPR) repeat protein
MDVQSPAGPAMMAGVLRRLSSSTFVGRQDELAVLEAGVERAAGGTPAFAFVAGESGVGKSRLIAELEARARERGAQVFVGHCLPLGGTVIPYAALLDALRPVARELALCGDELRGALAPESRAALTELMPEFGSPDGSMPLAEERPGRQARLFEALLALLERLGSEQPIVLVLEDLHWADPSTRDFLVFLVRSARSEPLSVVMTYRSDELHRRHPLRQVLSELERAPTVDRLGLAPFTRAEVAQQLAGILDEEPASALVDRLFARGEGNALYTEELLAASAEDSGDILPESLRDALMTRVERLPDAAQRVVRIAAVAERPVRHELLSAMCELPDDELLDGAREAVAGHVLLANADGTYAFRHALVGEAVYNDLLPGERSALHASMAEALELDPYLLGEVPTATVAAELAYHHHHAHDLPRALPASVEAGLAAERVFAYSEGLRHFERAVEIWSRVPDAAERAGMDLTETLRHAAMAASNSGQSSRAIALVRRALAEVGDDGDPLRAAGLHLQLGRLLRQASETDESLAEFDRALELLPPGADVERARLREQQATNLMLGGRYTEAEALASEAAATARALGLAELESGALSTAGFAHAALGDVPAGLDQLRRARDLVVAGPPTAHARAVINLSEVLDLSGRLSDALTEVRAFVELAAARPEPGSHDSFAALQEVNQLVRLGRLDEARLVLPEALPGDAIDTASLFRLNLAATLAVLRGEPEADAIVQRSRRLGIGTRDPQWIEPLEALGAQLALRDGRVEDARAAVDRGLAAVADTEEGLREVRLCWVGLMVEAEATERARMLGDPADGARAGALMERLEAARAKPAQWAEGPAYAALARAEHGRLRHALAEAPPDPAAFAGAAEGFDALGLPWPAAYARMRAAEGWVVAGDRDAAGAALTAACTAARAMGAVPLCQEAEALGRRARLRTSAVTEAAADEGAGGPAQQLGLTPRELEVLLLVAEGRTNREIGTELFMSEKTASVHVSRILAKLGVGGRVEAAAVAHRLGLTAAA